MKDETIVIDFANEAEEIQESFQPYFERILLSEATDPNLLYDLEGHLEKFQVYDKDFGKFFLDWLFDRFNKSIKEDELSRKES